MVTRGHAQKHSRCAEDVALDMNPGETAIVTISAASERLEVPPFSWCRTEPGGHGYPAEP